MPNAFLKPANEQLKVRKPDTGDYLSVEGERLELTTYWRRRIKDGDVIDSKPARKSTPAKAKGA